MIDLSRVEKYYVACGYTDMRRGIDGLAAIVSQQFGAPLCEDSLFLFCGRRTDRIKALYFSGDGYVLLYKRLNNGAFQWPRSEQELRLLDKRSFRWLIRKPRLLSCQMRKYDRNWQMPSKAESGMRWRHFSGILTNFLNATLDMDGASVAMQIEKIHNEYASVIQYHNENSLSSVLSIAYLGAMQYYFKPIREFPTGRGFADFVFIPKPEYGLSYPAMVIELKWNKSAETALRQIKAKKYPDSIRDYTGSILLVGINYDEKTKAHECSNEKCDKE